MGVTLNGTAIGELSDCTPSLGGRNIVQPAFPSLIPKAPYVCGVKVKELNIKVHTEDYTTAITAVDTLTYGQTSWTVVSDYPLYGSVYTVNCKVESYSGECDLQNAGDITIVVTVVG